MFNESDVMTPMFVTETIGETGDGDDVSVQKVGDTEKFIVYVGNSMKESYRYGDNWMYDYPEAQELALNYAVGFIKGSDGDVTHEEVLR